MQARDVVRRRNGAAVEDGMADQLCARRAPVTGCVLPCLVLCVVL